MTELRAGRGIVLRTPLLPFEVFTEWHDAGDLEAQRRWLVELSLRPEVREALFLASSDFEARLEAWRREPGRPAHAAIEHALVKYVARMAGRATPFGLFAGVTAGTLAMRSVLELGPLQSHERHTRLDNGYLEALSEALARQPAARESLRYRPNTSLCEVNDRLRYAEATMVDEERRYRLVSVTPTLHLRWVLARAQQGARRDELIAGLAEETATSDVEAAMYVDRLVETQLLVPELGVAITGTEPVDAFAQQLLDAELVDEQRALLEMRHALGELDGRIGNNPSTYLDVAARCAELPGAIAIRHLFQVDLVKSGSPTVATTVAADVARALRWLSRTTPAAETSSLHEFRRAFIVRYEGRSVPLAEVLDEESGIGFEMSSRPGTEGSVLLAGIRFPEQPRASRMAWGPREAHLLRRSARLAPGAELVLDSGDELALAPSKPATMPDALGVMIRIGGLPERVAKGEHEILIESTSGPSGARLLGRFCHVSAAIDTMVRQHIKTEEDLRPGAAFVEIVHLEEGRFGNVLCRPVLRDREIAYLGRSGVASDRVIPLDDLLVSVHGERIVLTSRSLSCEVIPRMTSAHNFRRGSLGVYRFLCALQNQGSETPIMWSWGPLATMPWLPRVRLGNVILARAKWNLDRADIEPVAAVATRDDRLSVARAIAELRARRGLPRWIALQRGDNELPLDLDNAMLQGAFATELARSDTATVIELFPAPEALPVRGPEGAFTNQIVLTFTQAPTAAARPAPTTVATSVDTTPRSFPPGSSWLYVKFYTGPATIDRVLCALAPCLRALLERGDASHWFFVRYHDPHSHLRLRIAGAPDQLHARAFVEIQRAVAPLIACGAISRVQLDTYERELERYGGAAGIELCERLFWLDSEAALAIAEHLTGDEAPGNRWKLALCGCEWLLEALGFTDSERHALFARARDELGREHGADTAFYRCLGQRWRSERHELEELLARGPASRSSAALAPALAALERRSAKILELRDDLRALPACADMAWSLVHMHANRVLHDSHRAQELVLYDFLRRWHAARAARGLRVEKPIPATAGRQH